MEKRKQRNDLILIALILVAALAALGGMRLYQKSHTKDAEAVVTIDGTEYGRFPLSEDLTERIEQADGSYNVLVIRDGEAEVTEASCPDGICVKHKNIRMTNESIACLPNKVIVEIKNGEPAEADVIAN